jgi:hypothetical protein
MFRQRTILHSEVLVANAAHSMIEKRNGCNLATHKPGKLYSRATGLIDVLLCIPFLMPMLQPHMENHAVSCYVQSALVSSLLAAVSIMSCHELAGCT